MTTDEFNTSLKSLALSRKEFAEITGVAYSTISQWSDDKNHIPSWVESWLDNYKKAKAAKIAADAMREAGLFE